MNVLIGAGGTGQDVALGVLRLSYLTNSPPPEIRIFDSDTAAAPVDQSVKSGKLVKTRAQGLNSLHAELGKIGFVKKKLLKFFDPTLLGTEKVVSLSDVFTEHGIVSAADQALLDLLLDQEQQQLKIDDGFHGQPAVGSMAFAAAHARGSYEEWTGELRQHGEVRAVLAGSIMGGVGASVLPVLADVLSRLQRERPNAKFSTLALLHLPWFELQQVQGDMYSKKPDVDEALFDRNSTCLLKGYLDKVLVQAIDSVMFVGLPQRTRLVSHGGSAQLETAHEVTLLSVVLASNLLTENATHQMLGHGDEWKGIHAPSINTDPEHAPLRGADGTRVYLPSGKSLSLERVVHISRCLVAVTEALLFELTCEDPVLSHHPVVHHSLKGLTSPHERGAFRKKLELFGSLHTDLLEWLRDCVQSRSDRSTVRPFRIMMPDKADDSYFDTGPSAVTRLLGGRRLLAIGRRVLEQLDPLPPPGTDGGGEQAAEQLMATIRERVIQRMMG